MSLTAIIVAAGSSRRMGFDKLMAPVAGKPVLQRSIEAFAKAKEVREVIVVCPKERFEKLSLSHLEKTILRVDGGIDRHDSVAAGLAIISEGSQYVAVHDGARPLISSEQITHVYHAASEHQAAASARPVTETIKRADDSGRVTESLCRENLWLMETPQIFQTSLLIQAYQEVQTSGKRVTDEVSAMELIGHATYLVNNSTPNLKITYPQDIEQAERFLV
ncbi:MAG: 2-C-methyl-D-erythritol 4-phosphate cytidylyltransferase [Akkermansiaceae bacterium]